ncbi:unnamed protein product [Effrenium voratum]|uniref:Uncharacterized protein n=1 Tax=Effrenium voratum TaxID=2562239 RepID=A0AA36NEL1_9DINO|nr:unnamed protein product [Effrenium voratum]CAJ1448602.1 unnamed protein product [Effrenium voratum]
MGISEGSEEELSGETTKLWLYLFAFWSQFKPSEPFLVDYLIEEKGITSQQVYQNILDLFVYSRLPLVIIAGFCAELECCGCRAVLLAGAFCGAATVLLTRFGTALWLLQASQFTVSAAFASRISVASMAFAMSLPSRFQEAIHTLKAVTLFSNCCAAALGEVLRDMGSPLSLLFNLSFVGQALSLLCAAALPLAPRPPIVATPTSAHRLVGSNLDERLLSTGSKIGVLGTFKALLRDLWLSLWLRRVMWWTAWALVMNPVHGLTLTYWQSMVRSKHILKDHNGYLSACMYLAAAVLTLLAGRAAAMQRATSLLVTGSVLLAGWLLLQLAQADDTRQVTVYGWILLYQCLFEATTAVATFQVGAEVTRATAASHSKALHSAEVRRLPRSVRLTLLFSTTTVLVAAAESGILLVINGWSSMDTRFHSLGLCLCIVGFLLSAFAFAEAAAWRQPSEPPKSGEGLKNVG